MNLIDQLNIAVTELLVRNVVCRVVVVGPDIDNSDVSGRMRPRVPVGNLRSVTIDFECTPTCVVYLEPLIRLMS